MVRKSLLLTVITGAVLMGHLCAQEAKPLSNDDVVAMVKGGLGESTVISAIQSQDTGFDISATGLLQLKKSGISPKIMDAMLAAANKHKAAIEAAAAKPAPSVATVATSAAPGQPSVLLVQGADKQVFPAGHAQIVQSKAKASTLSALAADGTLSQSLTGVAQGLATSGMMHPGSALGSGAMMAMPMVGPAMMATSLLSHRRPTVTDVWALPGQKADTQIHNNQPTFEVHFADVPGINPDDYEPVLLKLEPTSNNFRLVGATQAKQDDLETTPHWTAYATFLEERVSAESRKIFPGSYLLHATQPLASGEYGVALRPVNKDKQFAGGSLSQNTGDGLVFNTVWSFDVQQ
jgi:hypothetical protein